VAAHKPSTKSVFFGDKLSALTAHFRGLRGSSILLILFYWLLAWSVLVAFFFSGVLKEDNFLEFFPSQVIFPLLMHTVTALVIAVVVWFLPRPKSIGAKTVTVLFLALCMVNYDTRLMGMVGIFRAFLPILPQPDNDIPVISLLFLLMLLAVGVLVGMFVDKILASNKNVSSKSIAQGVAILVGFLFIGQAIPTIKVFSETIPESSYQPTTELNQAAKMAPAKNPEKPDIYYIVLEDYENNNVLKNQFNADNSNFMNWLRAQNFDVNENALSQYPFTASSVSSSLNMSYHNDDLKKFKDKKVQSATLFFNMVRQAEVVKLLKSHGYTYGFLGNPYGAFSSAPLAESLYTSVDHTVTIFGHIKALHSIEVNDFLQSPYFRLSRVPIKWWPLKEGGTDPVSMIRNQINILDELANAKQQGGRFIFANILAPHTPSYINADCSISNTPGADSYGLPIKQKYFGEAQCMNTQIKKVISDINKNSHGQAVILLVSDEGQYPAGMNQTFLKPASATEVNEEIFDGSMKDWSSKDLQMKYGILQAVHIPKATQDDFEQMTSVNMFRVVLNRYFGYSYDYLPNCQFGVTDGRRDWYSYFDATKKVTGSENPACNQYK
jgi:hypothetical protein